MLDSKFEVLNSIAAALRAHGIDVSVDPDTVCIGRAQWDNYSKQLLTMLSAAPMLVEGEKSFHVFASEQYDASGALAKYSVKICDSAKREIKAWELDTKRGKHTHLYDLGRKERSHAPFAGSYTDIAAEIMEVVRMYDPSSGTIRDAWFEPESSVKIEDDRRKALLREIQAARNAADRVLYAGHKVVRAGQDARDLAGVAEGFFRALPDDSALRPGIWDNQLAQWGALHDKMRSYVVSFHLPEIVASGTTLTTFSTTTVMFNPDLISSLPDDVRPTVRAAVARLHDLIDREDWVPKTRAEFARLGLSASAKCDTDPLRLLAEAQDALLQPSSPETSPSGVLIPMREAIEQAITWLLPQRPRQEPAPTWREKIRSIGRQAGRATVLVDEFDRLAADATKLIDALSGAKQRAYSRDDVHMLFKQALIFLLAFLRALDEKKLRSTPPT